MFTGGHEVDWGEDAGDDGADDAKGPDSDYHFLGLFGCPVLSVHYHSPSPARDCGCVKELRYDGTHVKIGLQTASPFATIEALHNE